MCAQSLQQKMVIYIMTGVLAVLAFLCVSDGIPDLARRRETSHRPSRSR